MPDFSEFADDAKKLASEHPEQADQAFDKAADFANQETGNRFGDIQRASRPARTTWAYRTRTSRDSSSQASSRTRARAARARARAARARARAAGQGGQGQGQGQGQGGAGPGPG